MRIKRSTQLTRVSFFSALFFRPALFCAPVSSSPLLSSALRPPLCRAPVALVPQRCSGLRCFYRAPPPAPPASAPSGLLCALCSGPWPPLPSAPGSAPLGPGARCLGAAPPSLSRSRGLGSPGLLWSALLLGSSAGSLVPRFLFVLALHLPLPWQYAKKSQTVPRLVTPKLVALVCPT